MRDNTVRVRRLLSFRIRPVTALLGDARRRAERADGVDGQEGDAPAVVVRDEDGASTAIYTHVARAAATGRLYVQRRERPAIMCDRERADRPGGEPIVLGDLVHRVQRTSVGVNAEERGVRACV